MAFELKIETDKGAAMAEGAELEISRILSTIAETLGDERGCYSQFTEVPIRDINGNRVGYWKYTPES